MVRGGHRRHGPIEPFCAIRACRTTDCGTRTRSTRTAVDSGAAIGHDSQEGETVDRRRVHAQVPRIAPLRARAPHVVSGTWRAVRLSCALAIALVVATPWRAAAQAAPPPAIIVEPFFRDLTRADLWRFFVPYEGGGNPDYATAGNRATLGVRVTSRRLDLMGSFQYAQWLRLPSRAVGPGPLGAGGAYFDAARTREAFQLYLKAISARVRPFGAAFSIEGGRLAFSSGDEAGGSSAAAQLARERLAGRLVGEAESTMFERAFDGVRLDITTGAAIDAPSAAWHVNAALLFPTQGAFEESANPTIGPVRVLTASLSRAAGDATVSSSLTQVFTYHYRDRRRVVSRPDNRGLSAAFAAIDLTTAGASHIVTRAAGRGAIDVVLWAGVQWGRWYEQSHRAHRVVAEGGYAWSQGWRPRVRAGWLAASGDGDAADARHETFFAMLPTTPPPVLAATFAQMNLREAFAEVRMAPAPRVTAAATVRRLWLARAADRWYSGTGATVLRGTPFGFTTRPSSGSTDLALVVDGTASLQIRPVWRLQASGALVRGGDVVRTSFAGRRLIVLTVDSVFEWRTRL